MYHTLLINAHFQHAKYLVACRSPASPGHGRQIHPKNKSMVPCSETVAVIHPSSSFAATTTGATSASNPLLWTVPAPPRQSLAPPAELAARSPAWRVNQLHKWPGIFHSSWTTMEEKKHHWPPSSITKHHYSWGTMIVEHQTFSTITNYCKPSIEPSLILEPS